MATVIWIIFFASFSLVVATEQTQDRQKRAVDPNFLRRYNHLRQAFSDKPWVFGYLKYFLRNRGQRRERRAVADSYSPSFGNFQTRQVSRNPANFGNGFQTRQVDTRNQASFGNGFQTRQVDTRNPANFGNGFPTTQDNRYPPNLGNFGNGALTFTNPNRPTRRPQSTKRETTKRRKPFRPPMIFF